MGWGGVGGGGGGGGIGEGWLPGGGDAEGLTEWSKVWRPEQEAVCCYWSSVGRGGSWSGKLGPAGGRSFLQVKGVRTLKIV